jgi:hypothetical protein
MKARPAMAGTVPDDLTVTPATAPAHHEKTLIGNA